MHVMKWICYATGYVFIISGMMKLINPDFKEIFAGVGLPFPEVMLLFVALIELGCGMLVASRMHMNIAVAPLLFIMLGALYFTKVPLIGTTGVLNFAFQARLDIVLVIMLLIIWQYARRRVAS
ncbi:DoxX family protein [Oceanobacillus sp. FSL K6-2867]|uniref:DoxX family protein n=1 Tax=Oceanobacillus sp. FSL K6-2867 TaxID=2954748 RepID=UPI0030DBBBBE